MLAKVQQWGNSQGIRIPKSLLEDACISVGDEVTVAAKNGTLIVAPARIRRKKYNLKDLVAKIPKGSRSKETGWGKPVGKEVW